MICQLVAQRTEAAGEACGKWTQLPRSSPATPGYR
jgi:hypothetical protein